MRKLLMKEIRLSSHPLSFVFVLFSFLFLVPGYPVLCAPFFVTLGLFQSFQKARENGDILFSVLLPVPKRDCVRGKYFFVCLIEMSAFVLMAAVSVVRAVFLRDSEVYLSNPLMNANGFALALVLVIFALFNRMFVSGFFRTAYGLGLPFLKYAVTAFLAVSFGETVHHLPGCMWFDDYSGLQFILLAAGCILYMMVTVLSYRVSVRRFERLDL